MEKSKLLQVIAAIMITSMAVSMLSISTTTVSATPDVGADIDRPTVKPGSYVLTITVTAGDTAIDNVRIIMPSGFTGFAPTENVPKDNVVELAATDNENVVLAAGTKVKLIGLTTVRLYENENLIRVAGDNVYYENAAGGFSENLRLIDNVVINKNAIVNATGLTTNDNVLLVEKRTLALDENDVVTIAETVVVRVSGNIVRLPENTLLKVRDDTNAMNLTTGDNVTTEKEKTIILNNGVNWITQSAVQAFRYSLSDQMTLPAGAWVRLWVIPGETDDNRVTLAAGSKVSLDTDTTVMLYENQQVTRVAPGATENVLLTDPAAAENQPKDWMQAVISATTVEWKGIPDNRIAAGASLLFPFAVTVPNVSGAQTINVRTTDIDGVPVIKPVTLTVDNTPPTVTVTASPSWAKDNVAVTITVTASEKLAKLDNVMVAENNALENTQVIMTPTTADNIVWTGTYTTGDNVLRDGTATIYVIGAQFEDLVGNAGSDAESTFTVDRMKPPTPALTALTSFITENATLTPAPGLQVKRASWLIEGTAEDNYLDVIGPQEGMTVKIRVGTTVYTPTVDNVSGYFYQSIPLAEGKQEVGVQYVDKAGNVGTENAENVTLDTTKPSVNMVSPAAGAIINDNKPLIRLTISDATLGVENEAFGSVIDNAGYTVQLRRDGDNAVLATLTSITPPTSDPFTSFTFENDYPTELVDNWYNIYVIAGDNLQSDNTYFRFCIDTTKPTWTQAQLLAAVTVKDPTTLSTLGATTKKTSWLISGGARKAGSTINVYVGADAATATLKDTVTASTTLNNNTGLYDYSLTIALSEGANQSVFIEEIDTASNSSGRVLLGTYTVDATPPVIALSAPAVDTTTDAQQITVSGTITDAIVTDYQTLAVTIDCTGAAVTKRVYLNANGSFETTVPLIEGVNVINVIAADGAVTATSGNQAITTRTVTRTVTPLTTYAIILVVVALILAAIAIFRKEMK